MPCLNNYFCYSIDVLEIKKNTPKGALCKYRNSLEERLLNCEALRAFFKPDLESTSFSWTKSSVISRFFRTISTDSFHKI